VRADEAMDEERLRELVALGYISPTVLEERGRGGAGAGDTSAGGAEPAPPGPAADSLQAVSTEAFNLGAILQRQGDLEGARRQYEIAVERLPSFGQGWGALAQVAALSGDHCEAFELLVRGFSRSRTMPNWGLTGLVDEGEKCGRLAEVGGILERLRPSHEERSAFHAALGLLESKTGRPESALEHYRRALAIDPLDQLAIEETVALLRRQGREREAREFLDRAFDRAQGEVTGMNHLAVVALRQGWTADAERLLRRVLASDPGNPGVMANLASALAQQGKRAEALAMMEEAVRRDPGNSRNLFNLGAMLVQEGRVRDALAAFEGAEANGLRSSRLYIALAKMRFRLDDRAGSARELEKALAVDPGNQEARSLLDTLQAG
jgi:Tfp pilus assembly protein PilF